jgi:hypothetical protein
MIEHYIKLKNTIVFKDGLPYWHRHRYQKRNGSLAGYLLHGYRKIKSTIDGDAKAIFAHKLHWYMTYGEIPKMLDHIDRNPDNNKIDNLRLCNQSQNSRNINPRGVSRFIGVSPRGDKWISQISISRKKIHLGVFELEINAAKAYDRFCIENNLTHANLNFKEKLNV